MEPSYEEVQQSKAEEPNKKPLELILQHKKVPQWYYNKMSDTSRNEIFFG